MDGVFSVSRDRFAMLQEPPESGYDRRWEGVESYEGGGREGEEGEPIQWVGRLPQKLFPGRKVLAHG